MPWLQVSTPVAGSLLYSSLVSLTPLAIIVICLAVLKIKAWRTGLIAVTSALVIAVFPVGMPATLAGISALQGAAFGLFPICYIVFTTLLLFNITVAGGQFEVVRASIAGLTPDRRLQALLIAFCLGAFIEGSAGFGTPVAIAGATLVGLGFRPFYAAAVSLLANTAPVAFAAIGIPVVALAGVMGYDDAGMMSLSGMVGFQIMFISLFIPGYLVLIIAGWRKTLQVVPAIIVCGVSYAVSQWLVARYFGPYLPGIIASLCSLTALCLLLKVWRPAEIYTFDHEQKCATGTRESFTFGEACRAWTPYLVMTLLVLAWSVPSVKKSLDSFSPDITVPLLHNGIIRNIAAPEEALTKALEVTAVTERTIAALPDKERGAQKLLAGLQQIRAMEIALIAQELNYVGKGFVMTRERLAAYDALSRKVSELGIRTVSSADKRNERLVLPADLGKSFARQLPVRVPAVFKLNFPSSPGTAILIASIISSAFCGIGFRRLLGITKKTLYDLRYPFLVIATFLSLSHVMNSSGMTQTLGLLFTGTGALSPFLAPFLGWIGVFLTGSDTSSNVLFGSIQKATAEHLGLDPVLMGAANASGGVMGKMISPQSIAVATAATGLAGEEGNLFRFTLKHSLLLTFAVGVIVMMQAYLSH